MPTSTLVRRVGDLIGTKVEDERAEKLGMAVNYAFGGGGGQAAALIQRSRRRSGRGRDRGRHRDVGGRRGGQHRARIDPSRAVVATGDPRPGLVAHLVYGVALGGLLLVGDAVLEE
jgi:hypothetical protein